MSSAAAPRIALDLRDLEVYFTPPPRDGDKPAAPGGETRFHLRIPELHLRGGEMVGIAGRSGEGKSTLLYVLALLLRPPCADVTYEYPSPDGVQRSFHYLTPNGPASPADIEKVRNEAFGFIFQQHFLLPYFNIADNVSLPVMVRPGFDPAAVQGVIGGLLDELGLERQHQKKRPAQLSGGQNQRVAVARALLHEPPFLFADEPTANLDRHKREVVLRRLRAAADRGKCVVLVSHELGDLANYCDKVYMVQENKLIDPFAAGAGRGDLPVLLKDDGASVPRTGRA